MKLLKLEGENYGQYKKLGPIYFPSQGIIGLLGPIGAGKTTILSAIEMALYGNVTNVKSSEIKYMESPKKSKWWIELIFEIDENQYKVYRHETTSKSFLAINGETVQIGQTNVTDHITQTVLDLDQQSFLNAFYGKQDEFDQLTKLTNEKRKKEISKILKLSNIDKAIDDLRSDKNTLNTVINEQKNHIVDPSEITEKKERLNESWKDLITVFNEKQTKVNQMDQMLEKKNEEIKSLEIKKNSFDQLTNHINKLQAEKTFINQEIIPSIDEQISRINIEKESLSVLENDIKDLNKIETNLNEMEKEKQKFDHLKHLNTQKENSKKDLIDIKTKLNHLKENSESIQSSLSKYNELELKGELKKQLLLIKELEQKKAVVHSNTLRVVSEGKAQREELNKLKELGGQSTCPTCNQVLGKHLDTIIQSLQSNIEHLQLEYKKLSTNEEAVSNQIVRVQEEVKLIEKKINDISVLKEQQNICAESLKNNKSIFDKLKNEYESTEKSIELLGEVSYDENKVNLLKEQLKMIYHKQERIQSIKTSLKQLPQLMENKDKKMKEIESLTKEMELNKKKQIQIDFDEQSFNQLKLDLDEDRKKVRVNEQELRSLSNQLSALKKEAELLVEKEKENKDKSELLNNRVKEFSALLYVEDLFKKYKVDQLSKLAPTIESIMQNLLSYLTDGKYDRVHLDENYNVFVYRNLIKTPLHLFSGGEKKLISLVQRLAISQVIASQTSKEFNFLALDEVLGSMDEIRQEGIFSGLRRLNGLFEQILMITHNSNLNDMFDHILQVEQQADLSSEIKWVNDWDQESVINNII